MNKKEAAAFLEISERTVSRHVTSGKLPARYVAGPNGKQLDFNEADLAAFKVMLDAEMQPRQGMTPAHDTAATPATTTAIVPRVAGELTLNNTALAVREPMTGEARHASHDKALALIAEAIARANRDWLTFDEAVIESGVPRSMLNEARKAGELPARKMGRGYKVHHADLTAFGESLRQGRDSEK